MSNQAQTQGMDRIIEEARMAMMEFEESTNPMPSQSYDNSARGNKTKSKIKDFTILLEEERNIDIRVQSVDEVVTDQTTTLEAENETRIR